MSKDEFKKEFINELHTYSNGAQSRYFDSEYTSISIPSSLGDIPKIITCSRLIIGTDAKRKYVRFQLLRFERVLDGEFRKKNSKNLRPDDWEYVGDKDMERFEGISFSPETMKEIAKTILKMTN